MSASCDSRRPQRASGRAAASEMTSTFAVKAIAALAIITALSLLLCYVMYRRMRRAEVRLRRAKAAAEEAARAAALAAPGGIDPDIVLAILNQGLPPTLDNV